LHHFLPNLFGDITNVGSLPFLPAATVEEHDAGGCHQAMRLLRAGYNRSSRPPHRRAAIASFHSIISSARASSVGGLAVIFRLRCWSATYVAETSPGHEG
jgi:hypothetical protein